MATHKIGVIVNYFRVGVKEGIKKAQEVGAEGIQIYAVRGEINTIILAHLTERSY